MTLPRTNTTKRFSHSNFSNFPWANQRSIFCNVPCVLGGNIIILGHYSRLVVHEHADDVLVMSVMTINGGQSAMSDGGTQMWKFSDTRSHFPIICFVNVNTGPRSSSSWDTWHVQALLVHTHVPLIKYACVPGSHTSQWYLLSAGCAPYEQYEQTWQQARLIIKTIYFGPLIRFLLRDRGQYRTGVRWGQSQTCKQCLTMLRMEITILDRGTIQHSTEPRVRWGQLKMRCLWQWYYYRTLILL